MTPLLQSQSDSRRALFLGLKRINALIYREVARIREHEKGDDSLKGLVIQEEEVDRLLAKLDDENPGATEAPEEAPVAVSPDSPSRWASLAQLFHLRQFDLDCLLICLAPEVDRRYELLYAYLQDDITKRRPSVSLCLDLLLPGLASKLTARHRFAATAPLIRYHLLERFEDPSHPHTTLLAQYLRVEERVSSYLLGSDDLDSRLLSYLEKVELSAETDDIYISPEVRARLNALSQAKNDAPLVVYLQGSYGSGTQNAAQLICHSLQVALLKVDLKHLSGLNEGEFRTAIELVTREARLQTAAVYWQDLDSLLNEEKRPHWESLFKEFESFSAPLFLVGEAVFEPKDELQNARFVRIQLPPLTSKERLEVWRSAISEEAKLDLSSVSMKFRFTPGQIKNAAQSARNLAFARDPQGPEITMPDLYEACRLQSSRKLSALSRKIQTRDEWTDLVLPGDRLTQLKEICNSVKYRALVYEDWGFARKLRLAHGINILFSGPSGTGKTMAASIIAGKLGLELYKTDLSTLVSKYIGETEKNLSKIFAEAETSNAILFFDEADALFGKRSEVRDSHDRYANIEVNYLLQKMEEHEGLVVLATNFRKNLDEAFVRRLHFTIDFPFPDEADRLRIWESIWPKETPGHAQLDFSSIARRFQITGGNIRNIALSAAFLAADNGGAINMKHLLQATRREYQKMGKVVNHGEFEEDEYASDSVN